MISKELATALSWDLPGYIGSYSIFTFENLEADLKAAGFFDTKLRTTIYPDLL